MAPPAVHSLCDASGQSFNSTLPFSPALVPAEQCVIAYERVGAGVVACSSVMLLISIFLTYKWASKVSVETKRLYALVILSLLTWLVEGGGLLSFGRLGASLSAESSPSSAVDAIGREATRGCLGILLFLLSTRGNPIIKDIITAAAIAAPPICMAVFQVMAATRSLPESARILFPRSEPCNSCIVWDSSSALAATLYGLGGFVAIVRFIAALRGPGRCFFGKGAIPDASVSAAATVTAAGSLKDILFFMPVLMGYCAADIFSISACSLGCTPYVGVADDSRGDSVARLLGVSAELPLLLGLLALCAYAVTHGGEKFDLLVYQSSSEKKSVNKAWGETSSPRLPSSAPKSIIVTNPVVVTSSSFAAPPVVVPVTAPATTTVPVIVAPPPSNTTSGRNPFADAMLPSSTTDTSSSSSSSMPGEARPDDAIPSWARRE